MAYLQAIGTGLSIYSAIQEGKAKQQEAAFNRQQLEQQAKQEEIAGRDAINSRLRDYDRAEANNLAFFAFLNRDMSDRSLKAFLEAEKQVAFEDVKAIDRGATASASQSRIAGKMETTRGANAVRASLFQAGERGLSGLQRYEQYKVD